MKIKIIGEGKHQIANDMLVFDTEKGPIEIDLRSAKEITWLLLDALCFSDSQMHEILEEIENRIYEREGL